MRTERQSGGLGQTLSIVALCISAVAVTLAVVALALTTVTGETGEDVELRLADRYEFTVDFVQKALERYESEGRKATLEYYNSPDSMVGDWYLFVADENGILIGHPNPEVRGRDLHGDLGVDVYGYKFGDVMLGATDEGLWVDYVFLNLVTGNQEYKHSWVIKRDGLLFGSGWYQILPRSPLEASKLDPAEYTVALVERAIRYYKARGREAAARQFSSPESVDGNWYVFMFNEDNIRIAHPTRPDLIGKPVDGPTGVDINGFAYGPIFAQTDEQGQWVSYFFLNPATGEPSQKHTWLQRYDGVVFGSGWYE